MPLRVRNNLVPLLVAVGVGAGVAGLVAMPVVGAKQDGKLS